MSQSPAAVCPSCGAMGSGRFCSTCGAPRDAAACRHCGAALLAGARFCPACGKGVAKSPVGAGGDRTPWIIAGVALAALLAAVLVMVSRTPAPMVAAAADAVSTESPADGAPAPDLSTMSPRERFDRLYNRVMRAAQAGDQTTVDRFTPMALMAYGQLDSLDADARYHAALLEVHSGDMAGPSALADTILARQPGHLFGYIVRGTVARWQKDATALDGAYAGFLEHYDAEMKAQRPEYGEHRTSVDEFHRQAVAARSSRAGT